MPQPSRPPSSVPVRAIAAFVALCLAQGSAAADSRPNILLVMVDDMGWSDLGCYGGEVRTPHLDALAAGGLRFSAFYNTGRCCPTRAALLTGLYPHQAGVGRMTFDEGQPGYRGRLAANTPTIAEVLSTAGYRTAMVGKWHLSLTEELDGHLRHLNNQAIRQTFADPATYPVGRGFERHYGIIWGVVNFYDPFSLVENTEPVAHVPEDYYITDAFTQHAVDDVEMLARDDAPFFLYLAHCAPHWPLHAPEDEIAKYRDTYAAGWETIRNARYSRQLELGLLNRNTAPLSERFAPNTEWADKPQQDWDVEAMACHAAMIDRVDQGIGRLVQTLKDLGEFDNTLILFLSDNGASREQIGTPGFDRPSETRDGRPVTYFGRGQPRDVLPGPETTSAGIGPHWANVANTPFRDFKASPYEGGIRTPLIAHWPQGLKATRGSIARQPGHVIDLMATCLDVAGAKHPDQHGGRPTIPVEGRSLLPVLRGSDATIHDALYFEHYGSRAVRRGDWKLVAAKDKPWELYDLSADETETRNVAAAHPDLVEQLTAEWDRWAERAQVLPEPKGQ